MATFSLSIIVAMTRRRVIGAHGALPWRLPADLKRFKALTMGKPVIMGRKTHESIGRVLPGRINIVISRNRALNISGCIVVPSMEAALAWARGCEETMVIGGSSVYAAALPLAERMYLTEIHAEVDGDTYFPHYDRGDWIEQSRQDFPADETVAHSFIVLKRRVTP
ncbi:MAG: dihydrofolate reductase [Gammaproteobacteria bacterium]